MKQKKNGFTLIELLAVIVILAIIALIAVPVILNIIDKANKSAFKDTAYGIISAGELYFAEQQLEVNGMQDEEKTFTLPDTTNTLGLKGNIPEGSITITRDGDISLMIKNERYCVTKGFEDKDVTITDEFVTCEIPNGENNGGDHGTGGSTEKTLADVMTATTNNCVTSGTCTDAEIAAGVKVTINVKENTPYDFYVIKDDVSKVTLIMSENLGDNVKWYADDANNSYGPTTALAKLASLTNDWEIPEFSYTLSGKGENGTTQRYPDSEVTAKARLITRAEVNDVKIANNGTMPIWVYANLYTTGSDTDESGDRRVGYWTSTAFAFRPGSVYCVSYNGNLVSDFTSNGNRGLRPVIELSKSL